MSKRVLLTGISGFLGSHIAEELIAVGYLVIGIIRSNSNLWRCKNILEKVIWINIEDSNWKQRIIELEPEIFIHSAWDGVGANDRDNWRGQLKNVDLTINLLELAKAVNAEKFVGFGSQAEYGLFSGKISEDHAINPKTAYGLCKSLVAQTIKCYSEQNNINWYWLRLFSFFGEKEDNKWFIPVVIKNIYNNKRMDMTPGLQRYAYMYVKDLARIAIRIIDSSIEPGIYNISSNNSIELKEIVQKIINIIKPENPQINFGAIPYRENQPMVIQGETQKLQNEIGDILETDLDLGLKNVINYILNNPKDFQK